MSDRCIVCTKTVSNRQPRIQCEDCNIVFHGSCVKLSKDDIEYLLTNKEIWPCEHCSKSRRKSMQIESQLNKEEININDIYKLLQEMREENKTQIKELEVKLGNSVDMCH